LFLCSPFDTMDIFLVFPQEFGSHRALMIFLDRKQ
jgi:hypothetical protein